MFRSQSWKFDLRQHHHWTQNLRGAHTSKYVLNARPSPTINDHSQCNKVWCRTANTIGLARCQLRKPTRPPAVAIASQTTKIRRGARRIFHQTLLQTKVKRTAQAKRRYRKPTTQTALVGWSSTPPFSLKEPNYLVPNQKNMNSVGDIPAFQNCHR